MLRFFIPCFVFILVGSIKAFAQPANDDCAGAIPVTLTAFGATCTSPVAATTLNATPSAPAPSCSVSAADDDIWYSFTATSQTVVLKVTNAVLIPSGTASVSFELYSGNCGALTSVECNSSIFVINGNRIINGLTIGNIYFIRFWSGTTTADMTFSFCIQQVPAPPANDDCSGAIAITTQPFGASCAASVAANTTGSTHSTPDPLCGVSDSNDDIWYSFTANSQSVILRYSNGINTVTGSTTQGLGYALYESSCAGSTLSCLAPISVLGNGFRIINGLTVGNTYYLRLFSDGTNNYMSFNFCVQDVPAPPSNNDCSGAIAITTQPFGTSCAASVAANTTGSTHSTPDPSCGVSDSNDDIWYSFTANSQSIILRYSNGLNTVTGSTTQGLGYALYESTCTGTIISCLSPVSVLGNGHRIIDGLTIGNTYYLRLFSDGANNYMSFNFCVQDVPPPPSNNDCSGAIVIATQPFGTSCAASVAANTTGSTHSTPDPSCGVSESNDDIWYSFMANSQTIILRFTNGVNTVTGSSIQSIGYALYNTSCPVSTTTQSCSAGISTTGSGHLIIEGLTIGNTYYLRLFSDGSNNYMSFNFCVQDVPAPPVNDECTGAIAITTQPFGTSCAASVVANTSGSTHSLPNPSCGVAESNDDVWYRFTANSQSVILRFSNGVNTVTGSVAQSIGYALYNTSCPVSITTQSCSAGITTGGSGFQIIDGLTIGNTYYLRLFSDGFNNYMSFDFCVQDVPPPPANDECVNAQPILLTLPGTICSSTYSVNTTGATQSSPNPNCTSAANNDDVWFSFTASAASVILRFSSGIQTTTNNSMSLGYAVYNTCPSATTAVACSSGFGGGSGFVNITGLTAGNTYYLRLFSGGANNYCSFNFCLQAPLQNDECVNAINIPVSNGFCNTPVLASLNGATTSSGFGAPSCGGTISRDVWFKATVPATGNLIVQTSAVKAAANNTVMVAYSGTCGALAQIDCDNDGNPETGPSANHSRITLTGRTPGEVIIFRVLAVFTTSEEQFAVCAWDETPSVLPPVSPGGTCIAASPVFIDSTAGNIYMWVPVYDNANNIMAEVYADGNSLRNISSSLFGNSGPVRQVNDTFLLDRNMSILPDSNFAGRIRIYVKASEVLALKTADSTVSGVANLKIMRSPALCSPFLDTTTASINTSAGTYLSDHYLQSSATNFPGFYIKSKCDSVVTWNGSVSTNWHDPANWDCGGVPWKYSNVLIPAGMPRYPIVSAYSEIKSIEARNGATVTVDPGVLLRISGQ